MILIEGAAQSSNIDLAETVLRLAQQLRQLADVRGDAPGLVAGE